MNVRKCITLDVNEGASRQVVSCRQNDNGKLLIVSLNQSGRPYFVDDDVLAVIAGTRPDGFTFFNEAQINDGRVFYELTEQNTGAVGTVRAELRLYKDEQLIASPTFFIDVTASAMDDGEVIESAEATALTQLIQEADAAIKATEASVITAAEVSVGNEVGEPSATVELIPGEDGQTIKLEFKNLKGDTGDAGVSCTHSWNGTTLSVTSASGTSSADLKGDKGDKGETGPAGPQGETGPAGPQGETGPAGPQGNKGDPGEQGIQGIQGVQGVPGEKGEKGDTGPAGYTPVKGTDYYTEADKTELVNLVLAALPVAEGGNF